MSLDVSRFAAQKPAEVAGSAFRLLVVSADPLWAPEDGRSSISDRVVETVRVGSLAELAGPLDNWSVVAFDAAVFGPLPTEKSLELLRAAAPDATLLALSTNPDVREAVEYLKSGVYEYLPLPVSGDDFSRALAEALDNNQAHREIIELNRMLIDEKDELEMKNRELSAVARVARAVSRSLELEEVIERLVDCIEETFDFDRVSVGLVDRVTRCEKTAAVRGHEALISSGMVWDTTHSGGAGHSEWMNIVFHEGLALVVQNPATNPVTHGTELAKLHDGPLAKVPMLVRGTVVGTITVDNHLRRERIVDEEVRVLKVFADTAAIAVENSSLYQMVRELSLRDELTGLYNRRFLMDRASAEVNHAERGGFNFSLLMLDLDHFKVLNDANDHLVGDMALKKVSKILAKRTRGIDTVARYGGEEIVILLPNTDCHNAVHVGEKLRRAIEEEVFKGEAALPGGKLTVSVGVASYPVHGPDVGALIEHADKGLYQAKSEGRNKVVCAEDD